MPSTKITLEYANSAIRELREDIQLLGADAKAFLIVNRENGNIIDYMPAGYDNEKISYINEKRIEMTLFEVLLNYIAAAKALSGKPIPPRALWITTARLCLDVTAEEFAKLLSVSPESVGAWERGVRSPKLDKLLSFARENKFPIDLLI